MESVILIGRLTKYTQFDRIPNTALKNSFGFSLSTGDTFKWQCKIFSKFSISITFYVDMQIMLYLFFLFVCLMLIFPY